MAARSCSGVHCWGCRIAQTASHLDRIARSTRLNILHDIGKAGATLKSLADAWADTSTPHGKLMLTCSAARRVRTLANSRSPHGRPGSGQSPRRSHGAIAQTDPAPTPRGYGAPRLVDRYRPHLRRGAHHAMWLYPLPESNATQARRAPADSAGRWRPNFWRKRNFWPKRKSGG
jgi:hypothetical protein